MGIIKRRGEKKQTRTGKEDGTGKYQVTKTGSGRRRGRKQKRRWHGWWEPAWLRTQKKDKTTNPRDQRKKIQRRKSPRMRSWKCQRKRWGKEESVNKEERAR